MNVLESSPLLFLSMFGAMGLTAAALLKSRPELLPAGGAVTGHQFTSIGGLRGLLAGGVFVHHAQVSRLFFRDGTWLPPQSPAYTFAGTGSVALFFMITALLFWGKLLDGRIAFLPLMRSRLRRILPMYLFSVLLIVVICIAKSGPAVATSPGDIAVSLLRWLCGGLFGSPDIDGVNTLTINGGVTWTLQYEWIFYALLPLLTVFASPARFALLVAAFLMLLFGLKRFGFGDGYQALVVGIPFIGGMLAAYAVRFLPERLRAQSPWISAIVAASIVLGALAYRPGYFTLVAVALFPAFACIALGNDIFGLLRTRWLMFLGEISYSVYLLHAIVLLAALQILNRFVAVGRMPYGEFVVVCAGLSAIVVVCSTLTFVNVEKRFMKGHRRNGSDRKSGAVFAR